MKNQNIVYAVAALLISWASILHPSEGVMSILGFHLLFAFTLMLISSSRFYVDFGFKGTVNLKTLKERYTFNLESNLFIAQIATLLIMAQSEAHRKFLSLIVANILLFLVVIFIKTFHEKRLVSKIEY